MYKCPCCGKELRSARGLAPHLRYSKCKEESVKIQFEKQGRQIDAQVHIMVERQKLHFELLDLADDIENVYRPLTICNLCGNSWNKQKDDWPMKQKTSTFDEFLDFMIAPLGGVQ